METPLPVALEPLTADLAVASASWFADDDEGQRRLDAGFYGVHPRWWRLVEQGAPRFGWLGAMGSERVGFVDLEVQDGRGSLTIYVRRECRRRGIGTTLLRLVADEAEALGVRELVGHVESGYAASIRLVLAAGFSQAGEDAYGPVFTRPVCTHNCE